MPCRARCDRSGTPSPNPADFRRGTGNQMRHQHPADDLRQSGWMLRATPLGVPDGRAAVHRRPGWSLESTLCGNHNIGLTRSTAARCISTTASPCRAASRRNVPESARISPTVYFQLPQRLYESLLPCLPDDKALRAKILRGGCTRCSSPFGAVAVRLEHLDDSRCRKPLPLVRADWFGRTELAFFMSVTPATSVSGMSGVRAGNDANFCRQRQRRFPPGGRTSRPGYWRQTDCTASPRQRVFTVFGSGDALKPVDPDDFAPARRRRRIARISSSPAGTWVPVARLRRASSRPVRRVVRDVCDCGAATATKISALLILLRRLPAIHPNFRPLISPRCCVSRCPDPGPRSPLAFPAFACQRHRFIDPIHAARCGSIPTFDRSR